MYNIITIADKRTVGGDKPSSKVALRNVEV